jgi:Spy/CpxP family protein refolding chaperone
MRANGETPKDAQPTEEERNARMELEKLRREIRNGKMKQILTPEQYEKYIKLQEEQKERMQRNWRGGRGGRGGHPGGRMPRQ